MAKLVYQNRCGLFPEHKGIAPIVVTARCTIPCREALEKAGAKFVSLGEGKYQITLGDTMPTGIVAVHLNESPHLGLRLEIEPEYPIEFPDFWAQVDFTPCPICNAPVVWYEAGYVPGYRVCTRSPHHHLQSES